MTSLSVVKSNGVASTPKVERLASAKKILAALAQLGMAQVAVAASGLVRNKLLAIYLKPEGFGEFAQMWGIAFVVYTFAQLGMVVGLSRNAAAAKDDRERQSQLDTANCLTMALSIASLAILVPLVLSAAGDRFLLRLGVHPGMYQKLVLLVLLAVTPVEALRNNYMSFLQGVLDFRGMSTKRVIGIVAAMVTAVPLIALFREMGAGIQTMVGSLFLAILMGMRCKALGYRPLAFSWNAAAALTLATLGGAQLISGFTLNSTETLIRAHLIATAGVRENGLYQAALLLSGQVTAVILGSVGAYSLATLSQTKDGAAASARMEELLRVVLPVSALSLGGLGLLAQPMLRLLYSPEFHHGAKYLPLLLSANYVQAITWVVGAPLLGFGLVRTWTLIQLGGCGVRYGVAVGAARFFGAYSVPLGLLAAMVFDLVANLIVCRTCIQVNFHRRVLLAAMVGGSTMLASAFLGVSVRPLWMYAAGVILLTGICAAMAWPELRHAVETRWRRPA